LLINGSVDFFNLMHKSLEVQKLAKRIKSLRIQKGYKSYENFAFDHGIPRSQYGRYETGTDIRYTSLLKIAQAFDITLEELFSEGFD